jgi:TPR repeat protein
MITVKKSVLVLASSYLLFYGNTSLYAEPKLAPIATVNLNEPPPPWEARANLQAEYTVKTENVIDTATGLTNSVQTEAKVSALTLEDDANNERTDVSRNVSKTSNNENRVKKASSPASGIAAWYRNRQHTQNHDNNFDTIETQAMEGDVNAQYQLGLLYYSGAKKRPQDTDTAIQWLSRAAEQGNSDAQYSLGLLYRNDNSIEINQTLAKKWLQASANQGHIAAKMALIDYANSSTQSPAVTATAAVQEQPQEEIRVASITAPPRTERSRINHLSSRKRNNQTINLSHLKEDAYSGDRRSQLLLGSLYEDGKQGVRKNFPKAAKWYRKAANQGYPQAQYNLGLLYEEGKGMTKNYHQATRWYKRAAEKGLSEAQNNLAVLYILGKGVARDKSRAENLFRRAAKQGNRNAIRNLNLLLEKS